MGHGKYPTIEFIPCLRVNSPSHNMPQQQEMDHSIWNRKKNWVWAWNNDEQRVSCHLNRVWAHVVVATCCYMLLHVATLPTCTPRAQHMLEVLVHFNLCLVTAWWLQVIRFECRCATMGPSGIRTSAHTPTVSVHMQLTEHPRAEKHVDPPIYLLNISKPSTWI